MARRNQQEANGDSGKSRSVKQHNASYSRTSSSPKKCERGAQRLSPARMSSSSNTGWTTTVVHPASSSGSSPRMSPGLLAGHYAGCKWSEPPLPSALPRPPQHWMSATTSVAHSFVKQVPEQHDVTHQLKVLLNVQA